jgi:diguanylate cyclase (GGDEF)-like protein
MLTLTAVAVLPVVCVAYVVVHFEVGSVTRELSSELHAAATGAQAGMADLLQRRELSAVATASSPRLQRAIRRHDAASLRTFARGHRLVLDVGGRTFGRRLAPALTGRVQLVSGGRPIASVEAQLPLDAATLKHVTARAAPGVRLAIVPLPAAAGEDKTLSATVPLTKRTGIRASFPAGLAAGRTSAAYHRVEEAGLLALLALMLLGFVLADPLLRAFRWTEQRADESRLDALTGIANRRGLEEILDSEIERARRFGHQLGAVILDLDHFKQTNDRYGHSAGDLLLREVGRLLAASARRGDTVARLGGEEFVVLLPETDLDGAHLLAERLRREVERHRVGALRMTASFGVAALLPDDGADSLLAAADSALYRAKENGRNRVENAPRGDESAAA